MSICFIRTSRGSDLISAILKNEKNVRKLKNTQNSYPSRSIDRTGKKNCTVFAKALKNHRKKFPTGRIKKKAGVWEESEEGKNMLAEIPLDLRGRYLPAGIRSRVRARGERGIVNKSQA